jgi:hypothetical protein
VEAILTFIFIYIIIILLRIGREISKGGIIVFVFPFRSGKEKSILIFGGFIFDRKRSINRKKNLPRRQKKGGTNRAQILSLDEGLIWRKRGYFSGSLTDFN